MKKAPFFSVIISNRNAKKWLDRCFTSLKNQTFKQFEVIFIDNDSTDDSVAFVKEKFPWVKVVCNKIDYGPGKAMNIAAKQAKGTYLFMMNTDSYLDNDTLERLKKIILENPHYHLIELNMKNYEKTNMKNAPYKFGADIFGYPMPSDKAFYADACGMAATKSLYEKLRGFDEQFYMYLDDLDFSWRARLLGEQVYLLDTVYIYHHTGGTSIPTSTHYHRKQTYTTTFSRRYHAQKNNIRMLIKNYSLKHLVWALPISIVLASAEGFLYLLKGNINGWFMLHSAIVWNILHLPDTLHERRRVQSQRTISDEFILPYFEKKIAKLYSLKSHGIPLLK